MRSRRSRTLRHVALAVAGLAVVSVVADAAAGARPSPVTAGVSVESRGVRVLGGRPEHVHMLRLNLADPHLHLGVALPQGLIGARRVPLPQLADRAGAAAAINADFFDPNDVGAQPDGGVIIGGRIVKSPRKDFQANLYVTRDGRARIGPVTFTGSVTRPGGLLRAEAHHSVYSVNTVLDARRNRITLATPALATVALKASCTVVSGTLTPAGALTVRLVQTRVTRLARRLPGYASLLACGTGSAATWLADSLRAGDTAAVRAGIVGATPTTLVSGGRVLVRNGRVYNDATGRRAHGLNPLTFGCVSSDGRLAWFGVVDGRWSRSRGFTYGELGNYLVKIRCWDAMVFDGGGSSTMVARKPGRTSTSVVNRPSDGRARPIAEALVIYRR